MTTTAPRRVTAVYATAAAVEHARALGVAVIENEVERKLQHGKATRLTRDGSRTEPRDLWVHAREVERQDRDGTEPTAGPPSLARCRGHGAGMSERAEQRPWPRSDRLKVGRRGRVYEEGEGSDHGRTAGVRGASASRPGPRELRSRG